MMQRSDSRSGSSDPGSMAASECNNDGERNAMFPTSITRPKVIMPMEMAIPPCTITANANTVGYSRQNAVQQLSLIHI